MGISKAEFKNELMNRKPSRSEFKQNRKIKIHDFEIVKASIRFPDFFRFNPKKVTFDDFQFQFEINRKRDTELGKLRKLLEDVHLESEETAHLLKKKHQEIVVDF